MGCFIYSLTARHNFSISLWKFSPFGRHFMRHISMLFLYHEFYSYIFLTSRDSLFRARIISRALDVLYSYLHYEKINLGWNFQITPNSWCNHWGGSSLHYFLHPYSKTQILYFYPWIPFIGYHMSSFISKLQQLINPMIIFYKNLNNF